MSLKAQLEKASPTLITEYHRTLQHLAQGLSESAKRLSNHGNRDAAKEILSRLKMVETEMEALRKRRPV
ncbi:coiled-coil and C2 domain-containing protein 1A isoform X2 [Arapaima gigas]